MDTDGLEIIKVQKDGDDIILVEGDLVQLDTVTVKQEPDDEPRISVKREPVDKSSIPIKREDEEQQQTIVTEEKIIGSIEIIKKEELDVKKPIVEDPPLEDPKPVEEHLAADPDPIPDAIGEDPVDPSGGNGDIEQTGEPAGVPETEAENQLTEWCQGNQPHSQESRRLKLNHRSLRKRIKLNHKFLRERLRLMIQIGQYQRTKSKAF